ncbi:multidrug transporter [Planctomycetaceae bacterium SCGC AG-212-F19]|nr:multidrug transporter [Planctomycetaceae bacterium SCGC AG-212-F19]
MVAAGIVAALAVGGYYLIPWLNTAMNTVSTDDAFVNGHVTMVAPRVSGEVGKVLVDDNMRVKKGDLLIQLDKEPFQVQVALKRAAVEVAEANLTTAESQARSWMALANSQRWKVQTASQAVKNQIALLNARVATLRSREAILDRAESDLARGEELVPKGGLSKEDLDRRRQDVRVAKAALTQAREEIFQVRATLGLMPQPEKGKELTDVPPDLDETFSDVRAAFSELVQTMTQLGVPPAPTLATPRQAIAEFHRIYKDGDIDRILGDLLPKVPTVVQVKAKLAEARRDLEQAELNLRYCDVISQIDGVVTSRNVNPGNNVQAGQVVMAVRSVTEIWIDANFKETQLADLRIGQRVRCEVDMYGDKKEFEGRITGFTMGTGQTLALLPPQNATGNFVKIVQRLPVRVELTDYDPGKAPLFVGVSVTPFVYYKEAPTGPHAGEVLQRLATLPTRPTGPNR